MVEIAFHRGVVFFERLRKMMSSVARARRNEIDFPALLRTYGRENGLAPGQRDRSRRQPCPSIRVIGCIGDEVAGMDISIVAGTKPINDAGIGLQAHSLAQPCNKHPGYLRALSRQSRLLLDDGSQRQCLIGSLKRQIGAALSPCVIEGTLHSVVRQSEDLN